MGYKTVQQSISLIDLDKVKAHCFVHGTDDDQLLNMYIAAACQRFTEMTGIVIGESTIEYRADNFADVVRLYRSPVSEIVSIKYNDTEGVQQTIDVSKVAFDETDRPVRLMLYGQKWPATDGTPGNIRIQFKAGHATLAALPDMIEWAILSMVATMYEFRENTVSGTIVTKVPDTAQMVIDMYSFTDVS